MSCCLMELPLAAELPVGFRYLIRKKLDIGVTASPRQCAGRKPAFVRSHSVTQAASCTGASSVLL